MPDSAQNDLRTPGAPSPFDKRRRLRTWGSLGSIGFAVSLAFGLGALVGSRGGSGAWAAPTHDSPQEVAVQLGRVLARVEQLYVDPAPRGALLEGAIKGMVHELDPHSSYMPREEYRIFRSDTEGAFGGVGVEVDGSGDVLVVIAPIEGAPAERAGMRSGDRILRIDGEDIGGVSLDKVVRRMRGAPGTKVSLTVKREGVKDFLVFDLAREVVRVASVVAKRLDGNVLYLRIKQFQERTHAEMLEAASAVKKDNRGAFAGVLLDLRANPGGLVDQATDVADEFLDAGTIFETRHRGIVVEDVRATRGGILKDEPIVALVDEWSASAAELLTGALQDQRRALVVGVPTFGKGIIQSVLDLPNGAGLALTTARYYAPSGHAIQEIGITPDVLLEGKKRHPLALREARSHGPLEERRSGARCGRWPRAATAGRDPHAGGRRAHAHRRCATRLIASVAPRTNTTSLSLGAPMNAATRRRAAS